MEYKISSNENKKIDSIDSIYVQEFNKEHVLLKIKYLGKLDKIMNQLKGQRVLLKLIGGEMFDCP